MHELLIATDKDLVRRAQSSLVWLQYDELIAKSWLAYTFSEGGVEVPEYKVFLDNVKKFSSTYLTEEYIGNPEFGVGDILLAPFIVSCSILPFTSCQY